MRIRRALASLLLVALGCTGPTGAADRETSESGSGDGDGESESETTETETGETETTGDGDGDPPRPDRIAVTADWRARRLSLLDYASLRDGADSREAALWKAIELPDHEPGPLEVELTPDGSLAVVAVAPGFFAGSGG
ncbi:MAG TPA: hypothetical protein VK034_24275, partial [Enhygromyxa sp.]|nr:hypothetical protein [Enhygromyxa sp.]